MQDETTYILEPTSFHSMREAKVLTDQLEQNLSHLSNVAANIKPQVVEMFSEMVNNAAEHGMSDTGAHCHVRLMPHRKGLALDSVITDRGPHPGHPRAEPRPAGGIRRTGPQARRPRTHLRHRQSHQGHWPLDRLPGMPEARQETPSPLWHRPAHGLRSRLGGILDHPRPPRNHRPVHDPHLTSET